MGAARSDVVRENIVLEYRAYLLPCSQSLIIAGCSKGNMFMCTQRACNKCIIIEGSLAYIETQVSLKSRWPARNVGNKHSDGTVRQAVCLRHVTSAFRPVYDNSPYNGRVLTVRSMAGGAGWHKAMVTQCLSAKQSSNVRTCTHRR